MKRKITVPSQITKVSTLGGGGMSLIIHTQDMPPVEKVTLMDFQNKQGWFLFAEDDIQEGDVPKDNSQYEGKTPSQILRGIIWRIWERRGKKGEFEGFYRMFIADIGEKLKVKFLE